MMNERSAMHRPLRIFINLSLIAFLSTSLCGCSKIKREFTLYQANSANDKGDYPKAIAKYKEVLEYTPNDESVNYNLGVAYAYNNQIEKARGQMEKLKKLNKDYANLLQEVIDKAAEMPTSR
jgi:tetratricopeptide (TPR) repeat protein